MSASQQKQPRYWSGDVPAQCQLSQRSITDTFIDGATSYGPWAIMHPQAHDMYGRGLGMGKGQQYEKQPDGRWMKTAG